MRNNDPKELAPPSISGGEHFDPSGPTLPGSVILQVIWSSQTVSKTGFARTASKKCPAKRVTSFANYQSNGFITFTPVLE